MLDTWKTVGDPFERNIWRDDFRSGSKSEVAALRRDVCCASASGHRQAVSACPKNARRNITSSAQEIALDECRPQHKTFRTLGVKNDST
jgi:hypothetical protein